MKRILLLFAALFMLAGCGRSDNRIIADGSYSCEVSLEGGSGKATVNSPAEVVVSDGQITATLVWSSSNYDYMIVRDEKYYNEAGEGEKSRFTVKVPYFDEGFTVIGDTTAMSTPHEIEYVLTVFSPGKEKADSEASSEKTQTIAENAALPEEFKYTGSLSLEYAKEFTVDFYEDSKENKYNYITIGKDGQKQSFLQLNSGEDTEFDVINVDTTYLVSTSVMDLVSSIGALENIKFTGTRENDWYLEAAKSAMDEGKMLYAGKYSAPDYELLLSKDCNFAIENTMIYHNPEVYEKLQSLGITVMVERSSYESTPLGRLEWIKLYGVLFNKIDEAKALFEEQKERIQEISDSNIYTNKEASGKTVAVFSVNTNGTITIRKPGDYISSMIELAGGNYVPQIEISEDENNLSTITINMEDFYAGARDADLLIYNGTIEGNIGTMEELTKKMPFLADFYAVKNDSCYCLPEDFFQQSTHMADFIEDVNNILAENGETLSFLYKIR